MLIQNGIVFSHGNLFFFLSMLYKLEFPMYFYCGVLHEGMGIEHFLGEKITYAVVAPHGPRSELAGQVF